MAKLRVLRLVGGAPYHDKPEHREILGEMLGAEFDVDQADDPSVLTVENLAKYDVVANYSSWWEPDEEQCEALMNSVRQGKGFACLHPSSATFWNSTEYLDMIGGEFVMHDPNKLFKVNLGAPSTRERVLERSGHPLSKEVHPIVAGTEDFEVQDELFYIQGNQTQWEILGRAEGHPVVFTKSWGKGRVYNNALGHDGRSLNHPSVRELYLRGIKWAGGQL